MNDGVLWNVPSIGKLTLGVHSTPTLQAHWIEHAQPIRELRAFTRWARGKKTLLDIGAAEGLFSLAFCKLTSGRAFAFEPSPVMLGRLRDNVLRNPSLDVTVIEEAIGSPNSFPAFQQTSDGMWMPSLVADSDTPTRAAKTLDGWCVSSSPHPEIVKIDVEGLELAVLEGASRVLSEYRPVILVELHPTILSRLGVSLVKFGLLIREFDYGIETLEGNRITDISRYVSMAKEDTAAVHVVLVPISSLLCKSASQESAG